MSRVGTVIDPDAVLARVQGLLGPERVRRDDEAVTVRPGSDGETAALLRVAREGGWRVLPMGAGVGAGMRTAAGGAGTGAAASGGPDLIVSTLGMAELLEHEPSDLICRVRAGLALSDLQEAVAREGQWLALDPPGGGRVTLGGVVATGIEGPLHVQYGRPRDQVLGLTLVDGAGRILALGGRVVKNVAGFDLVRLTVGSRGELGVVTEVNLRLYPRPEDDRTLVWSWEGLAEAWRMGRTLATLPLPLASAEMIGGRWPPPLDDSGFRVLIRITGSTRAVEAMRKVFMERVGHPLRELKQEESESAASVLSEGDGSGPIAFRLHALPERGVALAPVVAGLPLGTIALHLLSGTLRGTLGEDAGAGALDALRDPVRAARGTLRVIRFPATEEGAIEPEGGLSTPARRLQARMVRGFDPGGVLPGVWRDGLDGLDGPWISGNR